MKYCLPPPEFGMGGCSENVLSDKSFLIQSGSPVPL
jgi:hypothetical protein